MALKGKCDSRCQYADPDKVDNCDCECNGENHGKGTDQRIWDQKKERLSKTRKAFRKYLNEQEAGSGRKLYRRDREEFNKQYAEWVGLPSSDIAMLAEAIGGEGATVSPPVTTYHMSSEFTIIKDQQYGEDIYSHVRRPNGKTEYRKNDKIITKSQVPTELGW